MLTPTMISSVNGIHACIAAKHSDVVKQQIYAIANDAETIANELLNDDVIPANKQGVTYLEMLSYFIEICSYVEDNTDIPAIISDELYDQLVERLIDLGGVHQIGSPTTNVVNIADRPHKFPELRGSLAKVHFLRDNEVPPKDSRKSLEHYLNNVVRQMDASGMNIGEVYVSVDIKYDGVSHIIEGEGFDFVRVLTRGDVVNNLGKDLSPLFGRMFPSEKSGGIDSIRMRDLMGLTSTLPSTLAALPFTSFGIKVETYMPTNDFVNFKEGYNVKRCNRRSAVMSICNQVPDYEKPDAEYFKQSEYIRMKSFQIATDTYIELSEHDSQMWYYIGKFNNHHNYIYAPSAMKLDLTDVDSCVSELHGCILAVKEIAKKSGIPCDGAVITILDEKLIKLLGRRDNKNLFQVAFKFPAGEEVTTVEGVDFQVGPIAGRITPVVKLKPIEINGNTISNVTASNADKLNRLNLHIGDEVLIRYDIIPSIFKPSSCKESGGEPIVFPEECPICGGKIANEVCTNPDCPAKVVGHILNFVEKVNIKGGIGVETVELLVEHGFLKNVADLYRLVTHREELYQLPRLGETSIDKILAGIGATRELYPHQILGSIGIPSIGLKTMEKLCRKLNIIGNIDRLEEMTGEMCQIPGIGVKTVDMIVSGIRHKLGLIKDLCRLVDVKQYEPETKYSTSVCFTSVELPTGDTFKEFLEENHIRVSDSFTKSVEYLIVPDAPLAKPSTKMKNAEKWGTPMLTVSEAKSKWGYKNG